jgi:hypothetical protein
VVIHIFFYFWGEREDGVRNYMIESKYTLFYKNVTISKIIEVILLNKIPLDITISREVLIKQIMDAYPALLYAEENIRE